MYTVLDKMTRLVVIVARFADPRNGQMLRRDLLDRRSYPV